MTKRPGEAGKVRRSALISTFGPGAIVDLRSARGAPISGIVAGLEAWDECAPPKKAGLLHSQRIREPRLERALHVKGFRAPPVPEDDEGLIDVLPVVRFPTWLQCPYCNRLGRWNDWMEKYPGDPERVCRDCIKERGVDVFVVPVRFIAACKAGHVEEFPWQWWIGCHCERPRLQFEVKAAGLSGKLLSCHAVGCDSAPKSLEGILGRKALTKRKCSGKHPWFAGPDDSGCPQGLRALQRGAGNVYWGRTVSSIAIPPYSIDPTSLFGDHWQTIESMSQKMQIAIIDELLANGGLESPREVLLAALERWKGDEDDTESDDLLGPEYRQFVRGCGENVREGEFETVPQAIPEELQTALSGLSVVQRLREVQALVSFTRINPPSGPFRDATQKDARLSRHALSWLPANEMRGEGIFIQLNEQRLTQWEERDSVKRRFADRLAAVIRDLHEEEEVPSVLSPRFLLLHSIAHILIHQLSIACGYGSSSLRERVYSTDRGQPMSGILLLTAAPDSDGTLGGLAREGKSERFVDTLFSALGAQAWCASDPVCITGAAAFSSPRNGAACHACLLLPETSCAHFNMYLDRALLVGTPDDGTVGFFSGIIAEFAGP